MALVLMCGQPCSGKSTAAACLIKALDQQHGTPVILIDEPSLNLDRNHSYQDMPREKNLRGLLRSAVDRAVSKDSIVIVDSLNNIKGYRYELWCLARAAGILYCLVFFETFPFFSDKDFSYSEELFCTVQMFLTQYMDFPLLAILHCDVGELKCREWNQTRQQQGLPSYNDNIFDDLVRRFERPDGRNRWDSQLFEINPSIEEIHEGSQAIVKAVAFLSGDRTLMGLRNSQVLQPTIATQNVRTSETNSLYELDKATQEVVSSLVEAQAQGVGGVIRSVPIGEGLPVICLRRSVGLPELRRLRRTFLKLAGQSSLSGPPPPSDAKSAKRMFADYLNRELSSDSSR